MLDFTGKQTNKSHAVTCGPLGQLPALLYEAKFYTCFKNSQTRQLLSLSYCLYPLWLYCFPHCISRPLLLFLLSANKFLSKSWKCINGKQHIYLLRVWVVLQNYTSHRYKEGEQKQNRCVTWYNDKMIVIWKCSRKQVFRQPQSMT